MLEIDLKNAFLDAQQLLNDFCNQTHHFQLMGQLCYKLAEAFQQNHKILICGNGGSNCDAAHFAEEFTGQFRAFRKALPVIALSDSSHITCVGNDFGFDQIFSRGVEAYGTKGDWLIVLSTSGNSNNIVKALEKAKEQKMHTIALLGKDGGKLKGKSDYEWVIPGKTSDRIQELHMLILHAIIEGVERILFPENY